MIIARLVNKFFKPLRNYHTDRRSDGGTYGPSEQTRKLTGGEVGVLYIIGRKPTQMFRMKSKIGNRSLRN